uniref:Micro-fibrillar-associated protein 1 C-terminal domain-containing protein n=1 Tax=Oryza punctata TaxID=4537 RepID=A0A0E0JYQ3_ORYPU
MAARGKTGVSRYWPGRAPYWAAAAVEEARLVSALDEKHVEDGLRSPCRRRRVRQAPEIVSAPAVDEDEEEEEEDAWEERRARTRQRVLLLRQHEEQQLLLLHQQDQEEEQDEEEEEEVSESDETSESDDDDERMAVVYMAVPLFVPKSQRDTIRLKEEERQRQRRLELELHKKRLEDRKAQTRQILLQEIIKDELRLAVNTTSDEETINSVDTDDEVDQAEEHESWQRREMARVKRSREESGNDDKSIMEDENPVAYRPKKKIKIKKQMRFLQRYYHKGCFFQEDADDAMQTAGACEIYQRDFSGPTGLDKTDISILPKVMQVKHFGRRGGRKWTHLVNEDTTYGTC